MQTNVYGNMVMYKFYIYAEKLAIIQFKSSAQGS